MPVIHDAAEMLVCAMLDAFEDVYRERSRHVADELHGDDDPQMREHALEDGLYAGTVHDGIRVIGHVHPGSLVRVDVVGDLRTGALDAIAFSVQAHGEDNSSQRQ